MVDPIPAPRQGWHKEDIKAAIRKRGITLKQLSLDAGLSECAVRLTFLKPVFRAEQAVANFIDVPAEELWPDRYEPDGTPRHQRSVRSQGNAKVTRGHRQKRAAA